MKIDFPDEVPTEFCAFGVDTREILELYEYTGRRSRKFEGPIINFRFRDSSVATYLPDEFYHMICERFLAANEEHGLYLGPYQTVAYKDNNPLSTPSDEVSPSGRFKRIANDFDFEFSCLRKYFPEIDEPETKRKLHEFSQKGSI